MKLTSNWGVTTAVRVARLLLSSVFVLGGLDAFRNPASKAPLAEHLVGPLAKRAPGISGTEQIVRADGAAKVIGGLALAAGVLPRAAALGLAVSLVPTTLAGHPFWEQTEPGARAAHQAHFFKNAAVLGGLLLVAVSATPARRDTRQ